ncbi:MAG: DUF86 domain-containing protein [Acidobacteria bacterium]|nr:DUF86 domain-containing protein [Acidobacteriota bacterium]
MTSGPIDLRIVTGRLDIVSACLHNLRLLPSGSLEEFVADPRNPAAAESLLRRALEALLELARHLLAKGFGEAALEYRQVAISAVNRGLILDPGAAAVFPFLAGYRNRLTHYYAEVTAEELFGIVTNELGDIAGVAEELRLAAARLAGTSGSR